MSECAGAVSAPMISSQQFYKQSYSGGGVNYLDTFALRLSGDINVEFLRRSFEQLMRRQESLRTSIVDLDGTPTHRVSACDNFHLKVIDFSTAHDSCTEQETRARRYVEKLAARECDWSAGSLLVVELLRLARQSHVLVISIHHFITDGISRLVMFRELWSLYAALVQGQPSQLKPVLTQFSDYRIWLHRAQQTWFEQHEQYWNEYLSGATGIHWPREAITTTITRGTIEVLEFRFEETLCTSLRDIARVQGTTISLEAFAIYAAAASQICAQHDFIITTTANGRDDPDFEHVTGYIGHPFFWRMRLRSDETLSELLRTVGHEFRRTLFRKDFGRMAIERPELKGRTLIQWFPWAPDQIQGIPAPPEGERLGFRVELFPFAQPTNFPEALDIAVVFTEAPDGIDVKILYRPDVLTRNTIERFAHGMRSAADTLVSSPDSRIRDVVLPRLCDSA
jgi:hypothetical protein